MYVHFVLVNSIRDLCVPTRLTDMNGYSTTVLDGRPNDFYHIKNMRICAYFDEVAPVISEMRW